MATLHIDIFQGHEPSLPDSDVNVVIDVIRAFTTTHVAFERGVCEILLAGEVDEARALGEAHPNHLLAGERDAIKIDGFDLGNSPWEVSRRDLDGRGLILTTTNGVRATLHAMGGARTLVTGYRSAAQTAAWLGARAAAGEVERVNLIASDPTGDDDVACAEFIRRRVLGRDGVEHAEVVRRIRACESAQKFLDPTRKKFDHRDIALCTTPRRPGFVMEAVEREGRPLVRIA